MHFLSRLIFAVAGIYGLLILAPFYFMEEKIGIEDPPAITHPEFFYGFVGVALAWQVAFLVIALDPVRYRLFMIPAILEKVSFAVAVPVLFLFGRATITTFAFSMIDLLLGILFALAFWWNRATPLSK